MKEHDALKLSRAKGLLLVMLLSVSGLLACSSERSAGNKNMPSENRNATVTPQAEAGQAAAVFDLTNVWVTPKITIKKAPDVTDTGPKFNYDITAKAGQQMIALEMTLKSSNSAEPVFNADAVLIDSSGERYKSLFDYPAAMTTYKPGSGNIVFTDDYAQAGKKVSELGGKVVAIFSVPKERSGFTVEIAGAPPVAVKL
jgi:hypothetical protein